MTVVPIHLKSIYLNGKASLNILKNGLLKSLQLIGLKWNVDSNLYYGVLYIFEKVLHSFYFINRVFGHSEESKGDFLLGGKPY